MRKKFNSIHLAASLAMLAMSGTAAIAQQTPPAAAPVTSTAADNTRLNARDKSADTMKPTDQPNNSADIKVAAAVRKSIVDEKSLSMLAHNVKLVAAAGVVTLRGPVASADEKIKVGKLAASVSGVSLVNNELDIKQ